MILAAVIFCVMYLDTRTAQKIKAREGERAWLRYEAVSSVCNVLGFTFVLMLTDLAWYWNGLIGLYIGTQVIGAVYVAEKLAEKEGEDS